MADHPLDVPSSWHRVADRRLDGGRVQVWERPARRSAAPRLALVHGLEESWTSWSRMAALLPDVHLFGLDLPWRPQSDYRWSREAPAAGWLSLGLELLPEPPDLVVGHSFGATALLELLSLTDVPGLSAAALISPLYLPFGSARRDPGEDLSQASEIFRSVMRQGVLLQLRERLPHLSAELAQAMVRRILRRMESPGVAQVLTMARRAASLDPAAVLVPTLVVGGDDDPAAPASEVRRLAAQLSDGRLVQHADLSHFCQVEQPDRIADLITAFLARVLPARLVSIPSPRSGRRVSASDGVAAWHSPSTPETPGGIHR